MAPDRTDLPVEEVVGPLREALADPGVAVLVAPPGAGKTTVVPVRLLEEPWLDGGRIVLLEPRRLAARAAARRIAELLGEPLGHRVGYRTRDERVGGRDVRIEVVTEGILIRRLQRDPDLPGTALVVLDEVHERNLTTDLSLALALDSRAGLRPDLRILAMSATVDADRLAAVIGSGDGVRAPVLESSGRQHPVEVLWHPPESRDRPETHLSRTVAAALRRDPNGDVLVFLPGAAEIDRARSALGSVIDPSVAVLPLHGSLPPTDQDRALAPSAPGRRRIVLATDIAESSLTVDGVRIVVDAGLSREPRFDPATGLTRLVTEPASRAAADQRAGRAGRLGPGVAHRLWSEADHHRRPAFPVPEIAAVDLTGLVLELAVWGAPPEQLALIDPLPAAARAEATILLRALGALDRYGRPTALGREIAALPLHPRLAHIVIRARDVGSGRTGASLAALLDGRDVLRGRRDERPADLLERLALVDSGSAGGAPVGASANRDAVAAVRRRAREIARRARLDTRDPAGGRRGGDRRGRPGSLRGAGGSGDAAELVADLVAASHPDRVAQARGGGRFRFRDGGGGFLPTTDPLAAAPFLAVAEVDAAGARHGPGASRGDGRIRTAAALDRDDVERLLGDERVIDEEIRWDERRGDVRLRRTERVGALVLRSEETRPEPGPETIAVLLDRVREAGPDVLGWTPAARRLRDRIGFATRLEGDRWPAVDDDALLADLEDRIGPFLADATGIADLRALDLLAVLGSELGWERRRELDHRFPETLELPNGRRLRLDWSDPERGPLARIRVQELYGIDRHPAVDGGTMPVLLELLSPANRPIQITADLPGFWAGTWSEVRREMAGRYPKHDWPTEPALGRPPEHRPSRRGRHR